MNRFTALVATATLAASTLALAAPTTAAPAKATAYTVTAKINKTVAIGKETKLKVKGKVTPKAAGQKVTLQQRVGNKKSWKSTGTAKIKANGAYVLKDTPSTPGKREYRVVKPASNGFAKGISKPLAVEVFAWSRLAYRETGPMTNVQVTGATIATEYYASSLVTQTSVTPASVEYTLGRKCLQMRSTYALTDQSASGSTGSVVLTADGEVRANHNLSVGTIVADEVVDIEDAFRIKLDLTTTAGAVAAVGTPEVLCSR
jgi:hypothetical protein